MFGGYVYTKRETTKTIARFDETTREWSKLGDLVTARSSHGVVYNGKSFLVVGGMEKKSDYSLPVEKCEINGKSVTCTSQKPLENYYRWPALFLVDDTFNQ